MENKVRNRTLGILLIFILVISLIAPALGTEYPGQFYGPYFVGARWFSGVGAPSDTNGLEGDYYFDTSGTGNIYNKTSAVWQLLGSVIGPAGPAGPSGALDVDQLIASNKTDVFFGVHLNETALALLMGTHIQENATATLAAAIRAADDHILTNLSTVSTAQVVLIADQHIQINRSGVLRDADDHIQANRSEIILELETQFHANDSATLQSSDDHISTNITGIQSAAVLIADTHIQSNRSETILEVEQQFHANDSATLESADQHIQINRSGVLRDADDHIQSNLTSGISAATLLEAEVQFAANDTSTTNSVLNSVKVNRSADTLELENQFHMNDSATLRTSDDHIQSNLSTASTAGAVLIADQHIATNKTDVLTAELTNRSADRLILQNEIASNKTDVFSGVHLNETALLRTSDDHISSNLSTSANLLAADLHIASNKTDIFTGEQTNRSADRLTLQNEIASNKTDIFSGVHLNETALSLTDQNLIASNKTDILTAVHTNESALLRTSDDHISTNLSTTAASVLAATPLITGNRTGATNDALVATWANLTIWDQHIASNATMILSAVQTNRSADELDMEIQFHANDSTTLRTADDHISTNSSAAANLLAAGGLIASNKTDIFTATWMNLTIWDWHIASNKTDIFSGVHLNETALLRTADDHISTNSSAAANLLAAGNLIASNKTNIFTATHTNESALALTLQNEIASNKTDVFTATVTNRSADRLTVQNEIASNKTDALQATYTNRTLSGNFTIMAQSMIPESGSGPTEVAPNSSGMTRGPLMWVSLDYAISPMQNATIAYVMPSDWDGGTLAASYYWTSTGGGGTSTWSWDGYCGIDASNMNAPWGTPQTVTDTVLAINQIHVSAETAATTMGGSPAPGSICWFQFSRNGGTLSTPASLMGVRVKYGVR